jgi:hypothetical protein
VSGPRELWFTVRQALNDFADAQIIAMTGVIPPKTGARFDADAELFALAKILPPGSLIRLDAQRRPCSADVARARLHAVLAEDRRRTRPKRPKPRLPYSDVLFCAGDPRKMGVTGWVRRIQWHVSHKRCKPIIRWVWP